MRNRSSLLRLNKQVAKGLTSSDYRYRLRCNIYPSYSPLANLSSAQQTATTGFPPNFLPCNAVFALVAPSISAYSKNTCNRKLHSSTTKKTSFIKDKSIGWRCFCKVLRRSQVIAQNKAHLSNSSDWLATGVRTWDDNFHQITWERNYLSVVTRQSTKGVRTC